VDVKLRGSTTATTFVSNIDYDAKGQRQRIQYGNGSTTRYDHDPLTYRLTRLLTTRNSGADTLQDLDYTYDPSGNVMQITDAAQQTVFFNNAVVNPTALYEYDALYRLTKATGREHVSNGATTEPEADGFNPAQALPGDGAALRNYTRQWSYDQVGNILSLIHTANAGSWNRSYAYASDSNRLSTTMVGQTTDSYSHNAFGSFTTMPHLDVLDWDHNEHLSHVKRGTSETWYVYDSAGQRVRKLTEKPGQSEERIYLGGFEIYRKSQSSTVPLERETLHIMDGARRIALVETRTIGSDSSAAQTIRYQLDNHLQSATLELDETAALISYEEYYPYGDTSYQSGRNQAEVQRKRYRYTGKEKDEETGLYYHGARYYAPWLGRWTAADPAGMVDGACLYAYVRNHPTGLIDPDGRASNDTADHKMHIRDRMNDHYGAPGGISEIENSAGKNKSAHNHSKSISSRLGAQNNINGSSAIGGALGIAAATTERVIWQHHFNQEPGTYRGKILERLYGVPWNDNTKNADLIDETVKQVKSTGRFEKGAVGNLARSATRDAAEFIKDNPGIAAGKSPQAVIITETGIPSRVSNEIKTAINPGAGRKIPSNAVPPEHVRGLPGAAGKIGAGLSVVGTGLSGYALYKDVKRGDTSMAIGDGLSTVGGGLELSAAVLASRAAMTGGLATAGLGISITSGFGAYRSFQDGDNVGGAVGIAGVAAGIAITGGAIFGAPLLLGAGLGVALGVGAFHFGRWIMNK